MIYYTYAYLREDKTPYYIGKGKCDRAYRRRNKGIKPPKDKSRILILKQNLTEEESFRHEVYMIAVFGRKDLGTGILHNRTNGGEGASGAITSEEVKKKQSEAKKGKNNPFCGKKHTPETRKKISDAIKGENNPQYGKSLSEETRKKLSAAMKGKIQSKETRTKRSESMKGENNPQYGKSLSEETRRKMSEAIKGKKWWNDGCENTKLSLECPGDGWVPGRK